MSGRKADVVLRRRKPAQETRRSTLRADPISHVAARPYRGHPDHDTGADEVPSILLAGDDPQIHDALGVALPLQWPDVTVVMVGTGEEALHAFVDQEPIVVVLNFSLPGISGLEVLRQIRQLSDAPVVLLADRSDEFDEVQALQLGADDYVIKPFSTLALVARVRAILRRTTSRPPTPVAPDLIVGSLRLSGDSRAVVIDGRPVHLTAVEFKLLHHLATNVGRVVTYSALMTRIWGPATYRTVDHLRVCISRLQSKIEQAGGPRGIENKRGFGYRLVHLPAATDQHHP
jgi:DNA-binding response OmpR family regulator